MGEAAAARLAPAARIGDAEVSPLREATSAAQLRGCVGEWRRAGRRVGFVPTMGALHEGHLSLVRQARQHADRVVVSIFVNPAQFAPHEDLARYPRPLDRDRALLAASGCDLLFLPSSEVLYPPGFATWVEPAGAALGLEGELRPGHFRGVATVVLKLLELVAPNVAVFGQKDAQQLAVVRQLVRDFALAVEVVAGATVREADGLALSSRNVYLDPAQRAAAPVLWQALQEGARAIAAGERDAARVAARVRARLAAEPRATVDYVTVVDPESFQPVTTIGGPVVLPVAVRLGATRLIDNLAIDPEGA